DFKMINNRKCYKATTIYQVKYGKKEFTHPVVAWYSPELPFNFGPQGYGNLPGLILELQIRNATFTAYEIETDLNQEIDFSTLLKNVKIISELERDIMISEFLN